MCVVSCKAVLNYLKPISAIVSSMIDTLHMQGHVHAKQQVSGHSIPLLFHYLKPQYYMHCVRRLPPAGCVYVPQHKPHHTTGQHDPQYTLHNVIAISLQIHDYIATTVSLPKKFPIILL